MFNVGSPFFGAGSDRPGGTGTVETVNFENGLSLPPGVADSPNPIGVLGNNFNLITADQIAKLLSNREILFDDNNLFMSLETLSVHDGGRFASIGVDRFEASGGGYHIQEHSASGEFSANGPLGFNVDDIDTGWSWFAARRETDNTGFFYGGYNAFGGNDYSGLTVFDTTRNIGVGSAFTPDNTNDIYFFVNNGELSRGNMGMSVLNAPGSNEVSPVVWDNVTGELLGLTEELILSNGTATASMSPSGGFEVNDGAGNSASLEPNFFVLGDTAGDTLNAAATGIEFVDAAGFNEGLFGAPEIQFTDSGGLLSATLNKTDLIILDGAGDSTDININGMNLTGSTGAIASYEYAIYLFDGSLDFAIVQPSAIDIGDTGGLLLATLNKTSLTITDGAGNTSIVGQGVFTSASGVTFDIGAKTAGAVVLDSANYIAATIGGVPVKLLIAA